MWCYQRNLNISHITNAEVIGRGSTDREFLHIIKTSYLGQLLRNQKYYLPQLVIETKIEGKRGIGKKKLSWIRIIRHWRNLTFEQLIRAAQDRDQIAIVLVNPVMEPAREEEVFVILSKGFSVSS